jgi:hypothetical protein
MVDASININPIYKFALVIGINYNGSSVALKGCINDAHNIVDHLVKQCGYLEQNITLLTDKTAVKPTSINIDYEITKLINLAFTGARELFLSFSGHGTYVKDLNRDEKDGRDECIVPLDYRRTGFIRDDRLNQLIRKLPVSCKLHCLFDSCFSGTVLDLKYSHLTNQSQSQTQIIENTSSSIPGNVLMISGCTDTQTSADALISGTWAGAMTASFLKCSSKLTFTLAVVKEMNAWLKLNGFKQTPRLSGSRSLN